MKEHTGSEQLICPYCQTINSVDVNNLSPVIDYQSECFNCGRIFLFNVNISYDSFTPEGAIVRLKNIIANLKRVPKDLRDEEFTKLIDSFERQVSDHEGLINTVEGVNT